MKEMNRREFLTLSGAAVVALSLAGCGGGSYAPPAPTTSKEAKVLEAINLFHKEKNWGELKLDSTLNVAAEKYAAVVVSEEKDFDQLRAEVAKLDITNGGQYVNLAFTYPRDMRSYCDDVDKMKEDLLNKSPAYLAVIKPTNSSKFTFVGIKVFTLADGKEYWCVVAAEDKK